MWHTVDCANGTLQKDDFCEMICDYEDCSAERGGTCWREICDDGCGEYNCTIWLQENNEWLGEECVDDSPLADFNLQDTVMGTMAVGRQYQDTIEKVLDVACMDDPMCQQSGDSLVGLFHGEIP